METFQTSFLPINPLSFGAFFAHSNHSLRSVFSRRDSSPFFLSLFWSYLLFTFFDAMFTNNLYGNGVEKSR